MSTLSEIISEAIRIWEKEESGQRLTDSQIASIAHRAIENICGEKEDNSYQFNFDSVVERLIRDNKGKPKKTKKGEKEDMAKIWEEVFGYPLDGKNPDTP